MRLERGKPIHEIVGLLARQGRLIDVLRHDLRVKPRLSQQLHASGGAACQDEPAHARGKVKQRHELPPHEHSRGNALGRLGTLEKLEQRKAKVDGKAGA